MRRAFETFDMMYLVASLFIQFIDTFMKYNTSIKSEWTNERKAQSAACIFTCGKSALVTFHIVFVDIELPFSFRLPCNNCSKKMSDYQRRSVCLPILALIAAAAAATRAIAVSQYVKKPNRNSRKRSRTKHTQANVLFAFKMCDSFP